MLDRFECTIREYPPRNSTGSLGEATVNLFRLVRFIIPNVGYSFTSGTMLYSIISEISLCGVCFHL